MIRPALPDLPAADLAAARAGDAGAFERVVAAHRPALQRHCYRMLGSPSDAEDAVQETLLRAWRAIGRFEQRSSVRSWLYTIATNVCLTALERRPRRLLPLDAGPPSAPHAPLREAPAEPVWLEPHPGDVADDGELTPHARYEQRESVELAFAAAMQLLPETQRAVLLLRDVLGFAPAEIAAALDMSPAAVYSSLQRAHRAVADRLPERSQQQTLRQLGDARLRAIVDRYVAAWIDGDVAAIASMLTADATFAMPPRPDWYEGRDAIAAFLAAQPFAEGRRWRLVPAPGQGQVVLGAYGPGGLDGPWPAHSVDVLALDPDGAISAITTFHRPELLARFGLPDALDA